MRIYELARELGIPSKELVKRCQAEGLSVSGHMNALEDEQVELMRKVFKVVEPKKAPRARRAPARKRDVKKPAAKKPSVLKPAVKKVVPRQPSAAKLEAPAAPALRKPKTRPRRRGARILGRISLKPTIPFVKPRPVPAKRDRVVLEPPITVRSLSAGLGVKANLIIKKLMEQDKMVTINEVLDDETAIQMAQEFGTKLEIKQAADVEQQLLAGLTEDKPQDLEHRAPVVTMLGHVDHGKTTLLDKIRQTNVVAEESGGITQHMGAYRVEIDGKEVVFLDTPGHEAFTAMRARGANVTDVVVLVVAADDGVMPQTEEAISHARAAGVPIVVAINKMDMPQANAAQVKQQLTALDLMPEEWGGKTVCVELSALTGEGVSVLLEMLSMEAELLELRANPNKPARGTVLEAALTPGRGMEATVLIREGTLKLGDVAFSGTAYGRVRSMFDDRGQPLEVAGPSMPVRVLGLTGIPDADDKFYVMEDLQKAREFAEERSLKQRQATLVRPVHVTLESLLAGTPGGEPKVLRLVVKTDVKGTAEVLQQSLAELTFEEVRVEVLHAGVGDINEGDVLLADASDAVLIGFGVELDDRAARSAQETGVQIRTYRVIYEITDDVKKALEGLLPPERREVVTGRCEVRQVFHASRLGTIAGCMVTEGQVLRSGRVRVVRDGRVLHDGRLESLRRFQDDVQEVREGFECGIKVANFDAIEEGDVLEAYRIEEVARSLSRTAEGTP